MARPIIAFLTDFGTGDHYAGTMKGVALGICPDATLVDITHDIEPQDVIGGALELAASYRYFPAGTVFVAVVDPGVGSARRALAVDAGGHHFVGPDNGLLSLVLEETPPAAAVLLANPQYALPVISRTFEGRDRFAPAAAWLACGLELARLGPSTDTWQTLTLPRVVASQGAIDGEVVRIDRFGNLITNIDRATFDRMAAATAVDVLVAGRAVPLVDTYAQAGSGTVCALFGSSGRLEIALTDGDAARHLGLSRGAAARIVAIPG